MWTMALTVLNSVSNSPVKMLDNAIVTVKQNSSDTKVNLLYHL
jgi:hypothetical protein